jgi:hypothetical protein
VRVDAQEALAEGDKDVNVEERVRGQLVKLNPIDEEETAEELMHRNRKPTDEEVNKSYPET